MNKHWLIYGEIFMIITWLLIAASAFMLLPVTLADISKHHTVFERVVFILLNSKALFQVNEM